ncbi:alpha/beta fold hydrolase, partial [Burkholderia ubonensis]|uniref:alpha/beta fold hydrolase n=1 Tax=Burkholderia ubonensis TaxID=101571 RepID=UPI000B2CAE73
WAQLLNVERVGRHDNFFDLGGHSLLIVQLIERMRQAGLGADVREVFASPTLTDLARATRHAQAELEIPANLIPPDSAVIAPHMLSLISLAQHEIDRIVASVPGGAANVQDIYPLVPLQQGILFHHLLSQNGDTYLLPTILAFDSRQRLDQLLLALQRVVDRHDILRTAICWEGIDQPVQVVYRHAPLPVHEITLDADGDPLAQLKALTDPRTLRLDLQRAPLLQAYVAHQPGTEQWLLCLIKHHIVIDHVSLEIILGEVAAIIEGREAALPAPVAFRSFVAHALKRPSVEQDEAFFRERLADVNETTAPFGILDTLGDGYDHAIDVSRRELDGELALRVRACARQLGVSPAVLFHTAWALVVARCSGRDDVVFGTVLSGRLQALSGAASVLGMFINTLPIRLRLHDCSLVELVRQTQHALADLLPHEQAALALAQRCSAVPAPAPLFTSMLNYRHSQPLAANDWTGFRLVEAHERTNYPLYLSIDDLGTDFTLIVQANQRADALRVMEGVIAMLETITSDVTGNSAVSPVESVLHRTDGIIQWRPNDKSIRLKDAIRTEAPCMRQDDAPTTPTEKRVAAIWAEALQTESIGSRNNFFELGGHSLLALTVTSRIRQAFHVEVPLRHLFQNPTVASLTAYIEEQLKANNDARPLESAVDEDSTRTRAIRAPNQAGGNSPFLVPIQAGTPEEPPVFCFPGAGASVTCFIPFANAIGRHVPVYGLQPRGLDGGMRPHATVEAAVDSYIEAIRATTTKGGYRLVGHSFGGWLALETAKQLSRRNEPIAPLVLLDSDVPACAATWRRRSRTATLRALITVLEQTTGKRLHVSDEAISRLTKDEQDALLHEHMIATKMLPARTALGSTKNMINVFFTHFNTRYIPSEQFNGDAIIFYAGGEIPEIPPIAGWSAYIKNFSITSAPGNHMSMLNNTNVTSIAMTIKDIWKIAQ